MTRFGLLLVACALATLLVACSDGSFASSGGGQGGGSQVGAQGSGAGTSSEGLPCDVALVVEQQCLGCHADPPRFGAPMPLVSHADFHAASKSDPERLVRELVRERIHDGTRPMPPTADMPDADRAVLDAWLDAGAPSSTDDCGSSTGSGSLPNVGPEYLPCEPTHVFTAHAAGSDEPFHVPEQGADNLYQCFSFKSPFDGVAKGTAWAPIIGDERVLHHWILYRTKTPQPDGAVAVCNMPGDATFVSGWAPGGENFVLPDDVGLHLGGPDDYFILQLHYHNVAHYQDAFDASGVALCTTDVERPHTAGIFTLGSVNIQIPPAAKQFQVTGTCPSWATSYVTEPVHAIASFPHMHQLGRKLQTDVARGGPSGPVDTLVAVPAFDFESQRFYPHDPPFVIHPGDEIRTTCTYDNPTTNTVFFGEKTENEMCFNFVMVYPIEILGDNTQCGLF